MKVDLVTFLLVQSVIFLGVIIWRLLKKSERQENIIINQDNTLNQLAELIEESDLRLKEIDKAGTFEADDEVGWFFENIKEIQKLLNYFTKNRRTYGG